MQIRIAQTDDDIAACFSVMRQLRPRLVEAEWLSQVRRLQQDGYHLALLEDDGRVVAAAGYRFGENLPYGRFLYVDDLITDENERSRGYGATLLAWLHDQARACTCAEVHLDSGLWRHSAHRFYDREGMDRTSYHFRTDLRTGDVRSWVPRVKPGYSYIWEYEVAPEHRDAFVARYAPGGAWTRLFARAPGYVRTALLEDGNRPGRFVTVDDWDARESFDAFRTEHAVAFEKLDAECAAFTRREIEIGRFQAILRDSPAGASA